MTTTEKTIDALAIELVEFCKPYGYRIVTAESCTGGGIAHAISSVPGSSSVLWGGLVVYDRTAKVNLLGLSPDMVFAGNVYSSQVAESMAFRAKALTKNEKTLAIGVTGVAGPGPDYGVRAGTVYLCAMHTLFAFDGKVEQGDCIHRTKLIMHGKRREEVRDEAIKSGLSLLIQAAQKRREVDAMIELSLAS